MNKPSIIIVMPTLSYFISAVSLLVYLYYSTSRSFIFLSLLLHFFQNLFLENDFSSRSISEKPLDPTKVGVMSAYSSPSPNLICGTILCIVSVLISYLYILWELEYIFYVLTQTLLMEQLHSTMLWHQWTLKLTSLQFKVNFLAICPLDLLLVTAVKT